jgi:hypothetical protein
VINKNAVKDTNFCKKKCKTAAKWNKTGKLHNFLKIGNEY